ncbi:MAG: glycosyltransferase [Symploca sp. SIO2D2]|nr:glycosyltransferase [Symploca sp. SIO2D2]
MSKLQPVNQQLGQDEYLTRLPTISIVVPNYNGGETLELTLQSLIEQNYPKLEILVVDGGSTDNSVEIIKQFEQHITWWLSEKDSGQSNALNKGFAKCTGEIVNWLCSDDLFAPGALHIVGKYFAEFPDIDVLVGQCRMEFLTDNPALPIKSVSSWMARFDRILGSGTQYIILDPNDERAYIKAPTLEHIALMPVHNPIPQPSCFYRRKLLDRPQPIDESYDYSMDNELWNYFISRGARWKIVDDLLSINPVTGYNKTTTGRVESTYEGERIYKTYVKEWIPLTFWHRRLRYPLEQFLKLHRGNNIWLYLVGPLWVAVTLILAPFYGLKRVWALRWTR